MQIENIIAERIEQMIEPWLTQSLYELVSIELFPGKNKWLLRIYVDKENGITIKDCENISKKLSTILEAEDPIPGSYILEVSSPGPERILRKPADFIKFSGNRVKILLKNKINEKKNLIGIITHANERGINLKTKDFSYNILYSEILKANLKPDWNQWDTEHDLKERERSYGRKSK